MANSLLTPTAVTREALSVLHQNLTFIGSINRQYDSSFAQSGGKIGSTLKIRKPNQFTVRSGKTANVQHVSEDSVELTVATQKGVDMEFDHSDLALSIDDFSERYIQPAMARLAAEIEVDALSMYKDVWNEISDVGAAITYDDLLAADEVLANNLVPDGSGMLSCHLNPRDNRSLVSELKSQFNPSANISDIYRKGLMGEAAGFMFYRNTLLPTHTTGSEAGADTGANINGANQTGASITVNGTVSGTFKQGDIVCFEGCNAVHPETKADLGVLQQFVVTADVSTSYSSIPISPAIVTSGAKQNVSASPTDTGIVYKVESDRSTAIAASADYTISLAHHRDAFTFATADLPLPGDAAFAARQVMDGISMRIWKASDWTNDSQGTRIDILYGYKAIRPEWAVRLGFN